MYITPANRGYYHNGDQRCRKGLFLILAGPDDPRRDCQIGFCATRSRPWSFYGGPKTATWACDVVLATPKTYKGTLHACDACKRTVDRIRLNREFVRYGWTNDWYPLGTRAPMRAFVRTIALRQVGHFMMGSTRLFGRRVSISGSYGSDGLPVSVPRDIYFRGLEVPQQLYDAWNKGEGWNSAGSEAPLFVEWAQANLNKLLPRKKQYRR